MANVTIQTYNPTGATSLLGIDDENNVCRKPVEELASASALEEETERATEAEESKADKSYVDEELEKKANAEHTHVIGDVENLQTSLDAKANIANTYTKTEVDSALSSKADSSSLELKADKSDTYTKGSVDFALSLKADKTELQSKIGEAPADGKQYARKNNAWAEVVAGGGSGGGIPEAPIDGKQYARKDGGWDEVTTSSSTSWDEISGKPENFPPSIHTHEIADVNGLQSAINTKANSEDVYTKNEIDTMIGDVETLLAAL